MTDDLVKRLREGDEFERFMLAERAADRIEALETSLSKAVEVLERIAQHDMQYWAINALAELKEQK